MSGKQNKEVTVKEADEKAVKMGVELCVQGILREALKLYRQETHSVQQMLAYVRQLDKSGELDELEDEINEELAQGEPEVELTEAHFKMLEMATEDELEMLKSGKMDEAIAEMQKHEDHKDVTKEMLIEACEKKLAAAKELADEEAKKKADAEAAKNKGNKKVKK